MVAREVLRRKYDPLADHLDDREDDLRKAIAMSEEEEAKRRRQLEESNATALFDDGLQMCVVFSLVSEKSSFWVQMQV
jgi:hypothetical protein